MKARLGSACLVCFATVAALAADRPVTVRDDVGRPLSGAVLRKQGNTAAIATSDAQGVLEVPREPAPDDSYLVQRDGNLTLVITGATLRGLEDLILLRAASLKGSVRDTATGAGVKGVRVEVAQAGEGAPTKVVTLESGEFDAPTLAPGTVTVRAEADGYLTTVASATLAPGSLASIEVPMARPVSLRVAAESASKQPVSGLRAEARPGKGFPPAVEFQDPASGRALLPKDVPAGTADAAVTVPMGLPVEVRAGAAGLLPAARVVVARAATESVRLALAAGSASTGRFVDETGRGIAGVTVRPRYLEPAVDDLIDWARLDASRSKEDGTFRLGPLANGTYALHIEEGDWVLPRMAPREAGSGAADIGKIVLRPGGSLVGRVVRKSTGEPVVGARVRACFEDLGCAWTLATTTGKDGAFRLGGAAKGKWTLEASQDGLPPGRVEGKSPGNAQLKIELPDGGTLTGKALGPDGSPLGRVRVEALPADRDGKAVLDRTVETNEGRFEIAGAPPGEWTLKLRAPGFAPVRIDSQEIRASGATDVGEVLFFAGRVARGTVLGRDDARVAGATIAVRSNDSDAPAVSGADGRFEIAGLPDRTFQLVVSADGYAPSVLSYPAARSGEPLELPERGVRLSEGGTIEGEVRGEADAAVSGARVRVTGLPQVEPASTDLQGRYRLAHVPPGDLSVQMSADPEAPEGWTETRRVTIAEGAVQRVDFTAGDTVAGSVRRRGQPVAFARITAVGSGGTTLVHTTETDADGEFRLGGISDGTWTLHVASAECQARFPVVRVAAERDRRIEIELPPQDLGGFVLDESSGNPLPAAEVSWSDASASADVITYRLTVPAGNGGMVALEDRPVAGATARTGTDGAFRLCVPASGELEVEAAAGPAFEDAYAPLVLPAKQAVTIKLKPKGNEITVVVLRPDGARAGRDASAALVHRDGFYQVMPVGAGGEVKFERPKSAFRAWAGIPGVGLGVSDWIEEDAEVREPVSVSVATGGYVSIRGLGALRARADARGVPLDVRLVDSAGEDILLRADTLDVLQTRAADGPDEEVLGPFPNGRYTLNVFVGSEPAGVKDVEVSAQIADVDLTP